VSARGPGGGSSQRGRGRECSLFLLLAELVLGRVLDDEGVELVARVNIADEAAGLALQADVLALDLRPPSRGG
jgi:hypothetical protein